MDKKQVAYLFDRTKNPVFLKEKIAQTNIISVMLVCVTHCTYKLAQEAKVLGTVIFESECSLLDTQ